MRILVLGGTQFIGPHVVRELVHAGHDVTVFHRGEHEGNLPPSVCHMHGDFARFDEQLPSLRALRPEVVVDMFPRRAEDGGRVLAFAGVARRSVVLSSCDVYLAFGRLVRTEPGDPVPVPITEDSPLREKLSVGGENYDKIGVEKLVRSDPKLPCTILRLPAVHGPGDYQHRLYQYAKRMADNRPAIFIDVNFRDWRWERGYVENVAHAVALAAADDRAAGRIYNVADEKRYTESDWVRRIAQVMTYRGEIRFARTAALPKSLQADIDARQQMIADSSRIRLELGYAEIVPEDIALQRTIEWELANPPKDSNVEADYAIEDALLKG
jgi:nucleoside-diphosphate-sugar epimerase